SLFWLAAREPTTALAAVAFVFAGIAAQIALWYRQPDAGIGLAAVFTGLATALGCWQLKLLPYAAWFSALALAVWVTRLPGTVALSAPVIRLAWIVLLSHATLDAGFGIFRRSATWDVPSLTSLLDARCFRSAYIERLATLPSGLVATDIDLGPYIVALSPHRVVAAPYH